MDPIEEVTANINYGKPLKRIKKRRNTMIKAENYLQKPVDLQKTPFLFFPPGKEGLFLGIYVAILPYITGLLFIFFYVAQGKPAVFGSVTVSSGTNFFLVWMIGYEILAMIILIWITKSAITHSIKNSAAATHQRRRRARYR